MMDRCMNCVCKSEAETILSGARIEEAFFPACLTAVTRLVNLRSSRVSRVKTHRTDFRTSPRHSGDLGLYSARCRPARNFFQRSRYPGQSGYGHCSGQDCSSE
jgi:hypothetical protein